MASLLLALLIQDVPAAPATAPAAIENAAQPATTLPDLTVTAEQAPVTRQVCRREQITGSNRYRRVCVTEQQQEFQRDAAQRRFNNMRDNMPTDSCEASTGAACPRAGL
jgi:hypothetical protein